MKPLNQAERRKAFLNFLLLFIITVVIIVTTVFFSIQVPFAENKKMKEDLAVCQSEKKFAAQFAGMVTDLQTLIDTLQTQNIQSDFIESRITMAMTDLIRFKDTSKPGNDNVYAKMIDALSKLKSANTQVVNLKSQSPDIGRLQTEQANLMQRINNANSYIMQLSIEVKIPPPYKSF